MTKAAIIGAGFMGNTHAETLRRIGVEVAGALGVDGAETASFARRVNAKGHEGLPALLEDGEVKVHELVICEAIERSAQERRWVEVSY